MTPNKPFIIKPFKSTIPGVIAETIVPTSEAFLIEYAGTKNLKVSQDFIANVATMQPDELRRRILVQADYLTKFFCALDDIKQLKRMPGSGMDGNRNHREIRGLFMAVLQRAITAEKKLKKLSERC